jgi:hypothetical protein
MTMVCADQTMTIRMIAAELGMDKGVCQILTTNIEMKMVCAMMVSKI